MSMVKKAAYAVIRNGTSGSVEAVLTDGGRELR